MISACCAGFPLIRIAWRGARSGRHALLVHVQPIRTIPSRHRSLMLLADLLTLKCCARWMSLARKVGSMFLAVSVGG